MLLFVTIPIFENDSKIFSASPNVHKKVVLRILLDSNGGLFSRLDIFYIYFLLGTGEGLCITGHSGGARSFLGLIKAQLWLEEERLPKPRRYTLCFKVPWPFLRHYWHGSVMAPMVVSFICVQASRPPLLLHLALQLSTMTYFLLS